MLFCWYGSQTDAAYSKTGQIMVRYEEALTDRGEQLLKLCLEKLNSCDAFAVVCSSWL